MLLFLDLAKIIKLKFLNRLLVVFLIEIFKLINIPFLRGKENQSERKGFLLLLASNVTGRFQVGIIWEP